jgi:hypothetical protein
VSACAWPRRRAACSYPRQSLGVTPSIQAPKPAYTLDTLAALCGAGTALRVTGWLLYDSPHKSDSGRSTPWEVHPMTRIEVCCWRELG